jgi:ABC-type multidrug transport system ATPase subunit
LLENVALSAFFGQDRGASRADCWQLAEEALALVGLPVDPRITTDGLGAAALKKLELARALATQPRLLLADESLNGLDHSEMEQAADMLQRIRREKGITIVWVEHIMGVLMRVVDRVVVLDHGEVIFAGPPKEAQGNARVVEVYLGTEAVAMVGIAPAVPFPLPRERSERGEGSGWGRFNGAVRGGPPPPTLPACFAWGEERLRRDRADRHRVVESRHA